MQVMIEKRKSAVDRMICREIISTEENFEFDVQIDSLEWDYFSQWVPHGARPKTFWGFDTRTDLIVFCETEKKYQALIASGIPGFLTVFALQADATLTDQSSSLALAVSLIG